jgi:hypothetical protein
MVVLFVSCSKMYDKNISLNIEKKNVQDTVIVHLKTVSQNPHSDLEMLDYNLTLDTTIRYTIADHVYKNDKIQVLIDCSSELNSIEFFNFKAGNQSIAIKDLTYVSNSNILIHYSSSLEIKYDWYNGKRKYRLFLSI